MKHRWNIEVRIPAIETSDGNDRTEKQCPFCGLWKITVHPPHGLPWRLWRHKADAQDFLALATPPCIGAGALVTTPSEVPAL